MESEFVAIEFPAGSFDREWTEELPDDDVVYRDTWEEMEVEARDKQDG